MIQRASFIDHTATIGDATANAMAGKGTIANGLANVTVTNNLVRANSVVVCELQENNGNRIGRNVIVSEGSFIYQLNGTVTADSEFRWAILYR